MFKKNIHKVPPTFIYRMFFSTYQCSQLTFKWKQQVASGTQRLVLDLERRSRANVVVLHRC